MGFTGNIFFLDGAGRVGVVVVVRVYEIWILAVEFHCGGLFFMVANLPIGDLDESELGESRDLARENYNFVGLAREVQDNLDLDLLTVGQVVLAVRFGFYRHRQKQDREG